MIATSELGRGGPQVSAVGLGCMGMSDFYGESDEAESEATIRAALDAGITLLDTGDFYGMGHNELLIARALGGDRDRAFIQVKYGARRGPDGAFLGFSSAPAETKTSLAYTLQRLKTDHVDLYQPSRLDRAVPIEETVGAIAELVDAGYVRHIGLSEVSAATLRRAYAVHPISELQIEYSLITRTLEGEILDTCRELGVTVTAYGVFSRGLLSDSKRVGTPGDRRTRFPRFAAENLAANRAQIEPLRELAAQSGLTLAQLALAWVAAQGPDIVPLIGARTRAQLAEALAALELDVDACAARAGRRARRSCGDRGRALRRARDRVARQRAQLAGARRIACHTYPAPSAGIWAGGPSRGCSSAG